MDELLNFDEEEPSSVKRPQESLESRLEPLSKKLEVDDASELPEMDVEEVNQQSILSEENTPIDRNLMNEYEKMNPVLAPKPVSMDDEEIMELLNRELPEEPKQDIEDSELLATLDAFEKSETHQNMNSSQSVNISSHSQKVTPAQFTKEIEENIDRVLSVIQQDSTLNDLLTDQIQSKPSIPSASTSVIKTVDGISSVRFYLIDIFEDPNTSPGVLYLFGRVATGNSFESACLIIQNVPHHLYFLPAVSPSGDRYDVSEVKEEILDSMKHIIKSPSEIAFRIDRKKYAFEIEGIPTEEVSMLFGMPKI